MLEGPGSAERLRELKGAFQDVSRRYERTHQISMLEGPGSAERLGDLKGAFQDVSRRYERANKLSHVYIFALVAIGTFGFGFALTISPLWPHVRALAQGLLAIN